MSTSLRSSLLSQFEEIVGKPMAVHTALAYEAVVPRALKCMSSSYVTSREHRVMAESRDRLLLWRSGYTT